MNTVRRTSPDLGHNFTKPKGTRPKEYGTPYTLLTNDRNEVIGIHPDNSAAFADYLAARKETARLLKEARAEMDERYRNATDNLILNIECFLAELNEIEKMGKEKNRRKQGIQNLMELIKQETEELSTKNDSAEHKERIKDNEYLINALTKTIEKIDCETAISEIMMQSDGHPLIEIQDLLEQIKLEQPNYEEQP